MHERAEALKKYLANHQRLAGQTKDIDDQEYLLTNLPLSMACVNRLVDQSEGIVGFHPHHRPDLAASTIKDVVNIIGTIRRKTSSQNKFDNVKDYLNETATLTTILLDDNAREEALGMIAQTSVILSHLEHQAFCDQETQCEKAIWHEPKELLRAGAKEGLVNIREIRRHLVTVKNILG